MKMPSVRTVLHDERNAVIYDVLACRYLTERELLCAVRTFQSQKAHRRVKRGSTVQIVTIIGHRD